MKNLPLILCTGALLLTLGACGAQSGSGSIQSTLGSQQGNLSSQPDSVDSSVNQFQTQNGETKTEGGSQDQLDAGQTSQAQMVTLYIGMDDHFQQYQEEYDGTLNEQGMVPAEGVVAEMAQLTGWNLDLAGEITTGKGGITVTFGENCALFSGPPQEQKDEFHVYDSYQLDETILDSVKKTLQNWAVVPGQGDPDSVDVYYCGPDGKDLVLINSGWTISSTQPYEQFPQGN
ncbi:hypothetical protein QUW63_08200 [Pseudoflavonifractor phocaeensis]|uniref:hypothetical protein n=1 Tax=Pseudoflavonifractor phocaeensis TaxID=1870988 RepID=UPI0025A4B742|nr:hypothetical protein [Pseudoflavonifractor phocaeensis]MDM8239087.1 hypothetical protein [Pseudoflavonifractor phocaeensis]